MKKILFILLLMCVALGYAQQRPSVNFYIENYIYRADDLVSNDGVIYKALTTTTNEPPHVDWSVVESNNLLYAENTVLADTVSKYEVVVFNTSNNKWEQLIDSTYVFGTILITPNYSYGKTLGLMMESGITDDVGKQILLQGNVNDDDFNLGNSTSQLTVGADGFLTRKSNSNHYINSYVDCGKIKTNNSFYFDGLNVNRIALASAGYNYVVRDWNGNMSEVNSTTEFSYKYNDYSFKTIVGKDLDTIDYDDVIDVEYISKYKIIESNAKLTLDDSSLESYAYLDFPFKVGNVTGAYLDVESDTFLNGNQGHFTYSLDANSVYLMKLYGTGNWAVERVFDDDRDSNESIPRITNSNTSITVLGSYYGNVIYCTASTNITVTISDSLAPIDGQTFTIVQFGTGQVSVVAGGTATIVSTSTTVKTRDQYSVIQLIHMGTDTDDWHAFGDLEDN